MASFHVLIGHPDLGWGDLEFFFCNMRIRTQIFHTKLHPSIHTDWEGWRSWVGHTQKCSDHTPGSVLRSCAHHFFWWGSGVGLGICPAHTPGKHVTGCTIALISLALQPDFFMGDISFLFQSGHPYSHPFVVVLICVAKGWTAEPPLWHAYFVHFLEFLGSLLVFFSARKSPYFLQFQIHCPQVLIIALLRDNEYAIQFIHLKHPV